MNDYVIITDSTTDLPQDYAYALGLVIIPYLFKLDGREYLNYLDDRELSSKDFYNALRAGKSASTSLVTAQRYIDVFEPFLAQEQDILYLCLSTGLSGSYGQSLMAAETLGQKYPGRKLIMIDSLAACMGQGLLAYYAAKARDEGKTLTETAEYVKSIVHKICHWVCADDLNHLRRGGRVSGASAFVGTMLNIKPIIHVDDEGRLIPVAKVRGRGNAMQYMIDRMRETMVTAEQIVYISHSDAPEEAEKLRQLVEKQIGCHEFVISSIGPVIGAHTGPGTMTLFFMGNKR